MFRFFVDKPDVDGDRAVLTGENAKHAAVLRLAVGEEIILCDGNKTDYLCRVLATDKTETRCAVLCATENTAEPPLDITLYQALPKGDKLAEIVERCIELGVTRIVPVATARCITKTSARDDSKTARLRKVALAAAKQSGRGIVPTVSEIVPLHIAIKQATADDAAFVCYENERVLTLKGHLSGMRRGAASLSFFVGPEGGFAPEEIAQFVDNKIIPITLGPRILRTETAATAVLAAVLYEMKSV